MDPELLTPDPASARTLRRLVGRFRPLLWAAMGVLFLLLLRSAFEIAVPYLVGRTVNALGATIGTELPHAFVRLLWILGAVVLVKGIVFYAAQVAAAALGQDLENRLRADLFGHVMRLSFSYHDENRSGETIARCLRDMEKAKQFFREVWFGYVEIALLLIVVVSVTFAEHWTYGLMISVVFGLAVAASVTMGIRLARMDRAVSDSYDEVATTLQENVAGARVVRAFGRERHESRKFGGRMDDFSGRWSGVQWFWTGVMPWIGHLYHLAIPLTIAIGGLRFASGHGSVGEVAAVLLYVRTVHSRVRPLTRLVILGQDAMASASRVFTVLDRTDLLPEKRPPVSAPQGGGALSVEDVWFRYRDGPFVLRGAEIAVPAGGSLGLLGPTGAGKSTLAQLLPRFYDPTKGRIRLDGVDLRDLALGEVRRSVGLVFQETFLFSGTVAENIAFGRPSISTERILECARLAAADEFVAELPDGYDTVIGERGVSLSGGQRQRLGIARALALDPKVLVFDDATASVDAVTERRLFKGIREAARGRTTLVISQRVTSVRWCDRIAVLEEGAIAAVGLHEDLLEKSALYREIFRHQELRRVFS